MWRIAVCWYFLRSGWRNQYSSDLRRSPLHRLGQPPRSPRHRRKYSRRRRRRRRRRETLPQRGENGGVLLPYCATSRPERRRPRMDSCPATFDGNFNATRQTLKSHYPCGESMAPRYHIDQGFGRTKEGAAQRSAIALPRDSEAHSHDRHFSIHRERHRTRVAGSGVINGQGHCARLAHIGGRYRHRELGRTHKGSGAVGAVPLQHGPW